MSIQFSFSTNTEHNSKLKNNMEGEKINEDLDIFKEICIDSDTDYDSDDLFGIQPPAPPTSKKEFVHVEFEKYIQEKCENKIKLLNRSTFRAIKRPIVICFNHFREKCAHLIGYLDTIYELAHKYGEYIEFIAADRIDIDILYPHKNPIEFFCNMVRPERESLHIYAIDERKRIYQHFDGKQTVETLSVLCDNLLGGNLFKSQPIPEKNESFVKICVQHNYDELVTNSSKDILLVVGLGEYKTGDEHEPNYEEIAKNFQEFNLDIVYINADKNYVPLELNVWCYPTLIFIPHNDKNNFVTFWKGLRDTENLQEFLKLNMGPQGYTLRHKELSEIRYKPFTLPENNALLYKDLEKYVADNYIRSFKILDRNTFGSSKNCAVVHFMNFQGKGVNFYEKWLREIHQVAAANKYYDVDFLVADQKDMDVMFPKWFCKDLMDQRDCEDADPEVFAIDRNKRKYRVVSFNSSALLFYYAYGLRRCDQYYSQPVSAIISRQPVMSCVADNLQTIISKCKKNIFLTIYWPSCSRSISILKILDDIAADAWKTDVKFLKIDGKANYVPLEYSYHTYPVLFFIPRYDKDLTTRRYVGINHNR